ncbi:MAG: ABC transporter substrate-binding protein [Pseudomonadota bacterium]
MNKFVRWGASLTVLAVLAAPASAQTFRWTSQGDALTMDPHAQNEGPTIALTGQIYESLVSRDPALELVPELATEWEPVEGGWRFKLREDVKFHDGSDFTAEDVVFSFERANAPTSDWKEQVASITEVQVVGPHEVILVTDGPNPILPNQLTSVFMIDKTWAETNNVVAPQDFAGKEETYAVRNANGTGPYILDGRAPDELTTMDRNADWWGWDSHPGNIQRIEYRPIGNAATRVAALLSGEVDFVLDPPLQDLKRIESADGLKVATVSQIRSIFLGMDQGVEQLRNSSVEGNPFKDVRVREAFNLAIDKDAIQRVVMEGLSFPTAMITPPGVLGNTPENDVQFGFDLERAKSLMEEAGYADGFEVQLDCPNNRYNNDEKICQAAVAMLAKIGVTVNLEAIPKAQHFPKIQQRTSDFYMLGWGVPTLDSHYVFSYLLDAEGSWNATGYDNARVNEITAAIAVETDIDARTAMILEAWEIIRDEKPYIPLHHQVIAHAMSDKVDEPIAADDALRPRFIVMSE